MEMKKILMNKLTNTEKYDRVELTLTTFCYNSVTKKSFFTNEFFAAKSETIFSQDL